MQRNSPYKNTLNYFFWSMAFVFYSALSGIYLFLPPLLGVLFILYKNALEERDSLKLFFLTFLVLVLEAEEGFLVFTLLIYFLVLEKFITPKIDQGISALKLRLFLYILFAYLGYMLFYTLLAQIFLLPGLSFHFYIVYYIAIEYFLVSILL